MSDAHPTSTDAEAEPSLRQVWQEATGKVFKLTTKSYGDRAVTYTQIKAVKETKVPGEFDIEVLCAEVAARVLTSKRAHSSMCKEGVIRQTEASVLTPSSFGEECPVSEFEKVTEAILAHATTYLDWVMQTNPEENTEIEIPIDLPHLKLTEMEASLVRNSPFLIKDLYFITANSIQAAFESINQELQRASRNMRLTDAPDPVYVARKNEAVASLRAKLKNAPLETDVHKPRAHSAEAVDPIALIQTAPAFAIRSGGKDPVAQGSKPSIPTNRRSGLALVEIDSIALALLGKPSASTLTWERQNPSKEGAVFRIGQEIGLLEFVRWAHVSGRVVAEQEGAGKKVSSYFRGFEGAYSGPDKEGIYPLLKPAS